MSDLATVQREFADAILGQGKAGHPAEAFIAPGSLRPGQRLQVHRNNYRLGLSGALVQVFPIAVKFVGEMFLSEAAKVFAAAHPPTEPQLHRYGAGFGDFLDGFSPARQVPYIADLVRLEWVIHSLQQAAEEPVAAVDEIVETPAGMRISRNIRVVDSRYPVLALWMAGNGQLPPEAVNLEGPGQTAIAVLVEREVRLQAIEGEAGRSLMEILSGTRELVSLSQSVLAQLAERGLLAAEGARPKED